MPVAPTYPGVYIEELPSGVRTIVGVATSITVFVGWCKKGPTDKAELITSWSQYVRMYGDLDAHSQLSYAVSFFFSNGGTQAYIMRFCGDGAAKATQNFGNLTINASGEGLWGNQIGISMAPNSFEKPPIHFSLSVFSMPGGMQKNPIQLERFANVSLDPTDSRYVLTVVKDESEYIEVVDTKPPAPGDPPPPAPAAIPDATPTQLGGGADGPVLVPGDPTFGAALLKIQPTIQSHLDDVDLFNILCIPGEFSPDSLSPFLAYCKARRAFLICDCDPCVKVETGSAPPNTLTTDDGTNGAFYFPQITAPDPLSQGRSRVFPPSGFVAGIYARTDAERGVWKAPAGIDASVTLASGVDQLMTDAENGILNPQAVNCIRDFKVYGTVVWGARTLQGDDERGSDWKYVPVRRTALFIEESLYRALKWVVFEPNDEPLWAQIRLNVGAFMRDLFRQGAFQGKTPTDAYHVKCDSETTTQNDINKGVVNILVAFAPLKPAEFVVIQIQQMAGQIQT